MLEWTGNGPFIYFLALRLQQTQTMDGQAMSIQDTTTNRSPIVISYSCLYDHASKLVVSPSSVLLVVGFPWDSIQPGTHAYAHDIILRDYIRTEHVYIDAMLL
jgi:hypothetical protein